MHALDRPGDRDASHDAGDRHEQQLLDRLRTGDESAFAELFGTHAERLARFVYRYVHSMDTAQDVVQDVFIRLWERRQELPAYDIVPYLFRMARNRALDIVGHDRIVAEWSAYVRLEASGQEPSEQNTGEREMIAAELSARVNAALATLSPRAREIIRLQREDGLKPGEIAALLGLTPATVYVYISRALKQLGAQLRD